MNDIVIKKANESDVPVIEAILLDAVNWLNEMDQPLWDADEVMWDTLSKSYRTDEFFIAYINGEPAGCHVIVDYDPFLWPDIKKGESLFMHKLAVTGRARKTGVAGAMMDNFKKQGVLRGIKTLRLDTHALRPRLRAFYERHGFVCVDIKFLWDEFHVAFYEYTINND